MRVLPAGLDTPMNRATLLAAGYLVSVIALVVAVSATDWSPLHTRLRIAVHDGVTGVAVVRAAEKFSQNHQMEIVQAPYDELFRRELAALNKLDGEEPFDVIMLDDPWLAQFAEPQKGRSALRPLTGKLKERLASDYFARSCSRVCQYPYCDDGARDCVQSSPYYAVPFVANSQLFAYGPDVAQLPADWDAVAKEKARIDGLGKGLLGYVMRRGPGNSIVTDFMPLLWTYSGDRWRSDIGPLDDRAVAAIAKMQELAHDPGTADSRKPGFADESMDDFDLTAYWSKDAAAMGLVWSGWAMKLATLQAGDGKPHARITYGTVPGGKPTLGAWLLAVPANARNAGDAEEFLLWATEEEQLREAALQGNPPPLVKLLKERKLVETFPSFPEQLRSLELAHPRPRTPRWKDLETKIGDVLYAVTVDLLTPERAKEKIDDAIAKK